MKILYGWEDEMVFASIVTIQIAFFALCLGLLWGIFGALAQLSQKRYLRIVSSSYVSIIRGVPELLIIFLVYFGGTTSLSFLYNQLTGKTIYIEIPAFSSGVFALSLVFGAYAAEIFRGAIMAVSKNQIEAAQSIGMGALSIFLRITLPQAFRFALPSLGARWLSLIKSTSLVSIVGLEDIMRVSNMASSVTNNPFRFYLAALIIYLSLTIVSSIILKKMENRFSCGVKESLL